MFIYPKKETKVQIKNNFFYLFWGPTRIWLCFYVFPSRMKNQDYVVLWLSEF